MKRIRLLPLVLIAVSALLAVKVLGFVMGVEPFPVGPRAAVASGGEAKSEGGGHGEAPAEAAPDTSAVDRLTAPINLADEYKKQKAEEDKGAAGHGGGHGEGAPEGKAPAEDDHGAEPAAAAAESDGHGAAPAASASHGEAPADTKPASDGAPAADAGHGAPAADAHGKPDDAGHGAKTKGGVYTERPQEYSPPIGSSERAILEGLATRRDELDKRAQDLDLRAKLLEAAEKRLNERLNQLQSIETQLGGATGGDASATPAPASKPAAASPSASATAPGATPAASAGQATPGGQPPMNDKMAALVSLYEGMKPKAAAAVFDKLDTGTLLELAGHMNPRKLSPIIAAMDPEKASRITGLMVGAQQAQKRVVVQVEQVAPTLGPVPEDAQVPAADASELPQIMPASSGH